MSGNTTDAISKDIVTNNYYTNSDQPTEDIKFAIQYPCALVFNNQSTIFYNNSTFIFIPYLNSSLKVYIGTRLCKFIGMIDGNYTCQPPVTIMYNNPLIFIENSFGISAPFLANIINVNSFNSIMSIFPSSNQGLNGEVVKITLNPNVILDFRCYINSLTYPGVLYNDTNNYYCVLPALAQGSYILYLSEAYSNITYECAYTVKGIITMTASSFSGHNNGGYTKTINEVLQSWPSVVYLRFGYLQIIEATSIDNKQFSFKVPPMYNSSTVTVYISPSNNPYF